MASAVGELERVHGTGADGTRWCGGLEASSLGSFKGAARGGR